MFFINVHNVESNVGEVLSVLTEHAPLTNEQKNSMYTVESVPEANYVMGKRAVLKYDILAGELYYEYVDRPLTTEEKTEQRIKANEEALLALMDLQTGGAL